jgi:hypothetical protein
MYSTRGKLHDPFTITLQSVDTIKLNFRKLSGTSEPWLRRSSFGEPKVAPGIQRSLQLTGRWRVNHESRPHPAHTRAVAPTGPDGISRPGVGQGAALSDPGFPIHEISVNERY